MAKDGGVAKGLKLFGIDESIAASLAKVKNAKIDGKSYDDRQKERGHRQHEIDRAKMFGNLGRAMGTFAAAGTSPADRETARKEVAKLLQGMSSADRLAYVQSLDKDGREKLAQRLSTEAYRDLMKNNDLDEGAKHDLSHGRFHDLEEAIRNNDDASVKKWSAQDMADLAKANATAFEDAISKDMLSDDQREGLEKGEAINQDQRALLRSLNPLVRIRDLLEANIKSGGAADAAIETMARNLTIAQKAELSAKFLTNVNVRKTLMPNDMSAIMEKKKLKESDIAVISADIDRDPVRKAAFDKHYVNNPFLKAAMGK